MNGRKTEHAYKGDSASPGLVIGPLVRMSPGLRKAGYDQCPPEQELNRLRGALQSARDELAELARAQDEQTAEILEFQIEMAGDDELLKSAAEEIGRGASAAEAWWSCLESQIADYHDADDEYFRARAADLADLRDRVTGLLGALVQQSTDLPAGAVLLDDEMTPTRFLALDWNALGGMALEHGSVTSHVAMLARSRGVPMVTGLGEGPLETTRAVLDAGAGVLIADPAPATLGLYKERLKEWRRNEAAANRALTRPAVTRDGDAITVMVNVDHPDAVADEMLAATDGVGLMRTEFLYMNRRQPPDEDTQYDTYVGLLERLAGKPCVIRTLDVGGDKPVAGLTLPGESNPFLGLRGIRLTLDNPDLFRSQVRALLRAAVGRPLKVMLPMVTTPAEYDEAKRFFEAELENLGAEGVAAGMPPLGIMVETPACAVAIDTFNAPFYSIGSNDLTQYVMAASRDGRGRVAALNDPAQPAVLRLIAGVVQHGRETNRPVSLCGDMGSDPAMIHTLLGLGLDCLSVAPAALGRVKLAIQQFHGNHKQHHQHGA